VLLARHASHRACVAAQPPCSWHLPQAGQATGGPCPALEAKRLHRYPAAPRNHDSDQAHASTWLIERFTGFVGGLVHATLIGTICVARAGSALLTTLATSLRQTRLLVQGPAHLNGSIPRVDEQLNPRLGGRVLPRDPITGPAMRPLSQARKAQARKAQARKAFAECQGTARFTRSG
jgi:hypothetical protein